MSPLCQTWTRLRCAVHVRAQTLHACPYSARMYLPGCSRPHAPWSFRLSQALNSSVLNRRPRCWMSCCRYTSFHALLSLSSLLAILPLRLPPSISHILVTCYSMRWHLHTPFKAARNIPWSSPLGFKERASFIVMCPPLVTDHRCSCMPQCSYNRS